MRRWLLPVLLWALAAPAGAGVVASTPWVGALAQAAGAPQVTVIAPASLVHPPDYDPRPSDLLAVAGASHVLSGGYEGFAARLADAAGSQAVVLTVRTSYEPAVLEAELLRLGAQFGTLPAAQRSVEQLRAQWDVARRALAAAQVGQPAPRVAVHRFMQPWVALLGVAPVAVYGPGPLSPAQLGRLAALRPTLVLDNAHDPQGAPLAEASGARLLRLVNFPSPEQDLADVIRANTARLQPAFDR
ncbi:MAG: ABC transporter substrate-binding protein [Betaproteobacteria bacterium]